MPDSLQSYLDAAEGAGKVLAHAQLLVRLAGVYQEIVPPHLGQASRVANYKSRVVVIHASSGAVATKLRQMAPTLVSALTQRGLECSAVQVRVQTPKNRPTARVPAPKPLSVRTADELVALRDSLPLSPLRTALENLLARSARQE